MSSCEVFREALVLYLEGALGPEESRRIEEHLAGCPACRAERDQIGAIRRWLAEPELFEPVQDLSWQHMPEKLAARARLQTGRLGLLGRLSPRWGFAAAALVVLGCGLILTLSRQTPAPPAAEPALIAAGNEAFLHRIRAVYAREVTTQYLAGCQDLLLDLTSTEKKCAENRYDVSLEVTRARQLLQEKRMLDAELSQPNVALAKNLCDELEQFLVNLSTSQTCETHDTLHDLERFIEKEQLLLRINIAQSGIS